MVEAELWSGTRARYSARPGTALRSDHEQFDTHVILEAAQMPLSDDMIRRNGYRDINRTSRHQAGARGRRPSKRAAPLRYSKSASA